MADEESEILEGGFWRWWNSALGLILIL